MHRIRRIPALLSLLLPMLCLLSCVDDTDDAFDSSDGDESPPHLDGDAEDSDAPDPEAETLRKAAPWAIAVVGTDYFSTSISILERKNRTLFRENIIHSGTASSGLSIALSGDVVFPRAHNPENRIVLIDRYPNSVLTFLDPDDFSVDGQLPVATGFASNPHDFLWLSEHKAYVTRYETNPTPGGEAFDGGDDVLIVDPAALSITGRIPLAAYTDTASDPELQARPDQMAYAEGRVWVTLNHLSADFKETGEGLLLGIDPGTDAVVERVSLPKVTNCTGLVYEESRRSLYVSCSGLFIPGVQKRRAFSGIVSVRLDGEVPEASLLRSAVEEDDRPYGFDLDVAEGRWLLAVRFGDLAEDLPDWLVAIDLDSAEERVVYASGSPYGMGGLLADDGTGAVYVGDADPASPGIHIFATEQGAFTHLGRIDAHPKVGLPPRHIRFY